MHTFSFAEAVNLAARVSDAADRGEVLMTETTRAAAPDLPMDPVSRMAGDPARGERRTHDGDEIYFCSLECARVFVKHAHRYLD